MIVRKRLNKISIIVIIFCCFLFAMSFLTGCGEINNDNETNSDNTIDEPAKDKPTVDIPVEEEPAIQRLRMDKKYVAATVRKTPGATYVHHINTSGRVEYRYWQIDISVSPLKSNISFQDVRVRVGGVGSADNDGGRVKSCWVALNDLGYGTASFTTFCPANEMYYFSNDIIDYEGYVLILG